MNTPGEHELRIPRELLARPPRDVQVGPRSRRGARLMLAAFFAAGFLTLTWYAVVDYELLKAAPIQAKITRLWIISGVKSDTHHVEFCVDPARGIYDSDKTDRTTYGRLEVGMFIPVRTVTIGGMRFSTMGQTWWDIESTQLPPSLAVALILFSLMLSRLSKVALRSMRQVIQNGEVVIGTVVSRSARRRITMAYRVKYEYQPATGEKLIGETMVRRKDYDAAEAGEKIVVIYDPNKPSKSFSYTYCWYQVVEDEWKGRAG
jgi:hypothetical protein